MSDHRVTPANPFRQAPASSIGGAPPRRNPEDGHDFEDAFLRLSDPGPAGQDQFDAMTELFLGEVAATAASLPEAPRARPSRTDVAAASSQPPAALRSDPVSVAADEGEPIAVEARPAPIDVALVGHLPVLASAWVREYARLQSEHAGAPAALVRVAEGRAIIEIFGADAEPVEADDAEAAVRHAAPIVGMWILHADPEDLVDGLLEPSPVPSGAGLASVDSLTLLTGADEAAVVGAYRTLKQVAAAGTEGRGGKIPPTRLIVMGSPQERCQRVGDKLASVAGIFLGRRPDVLPGVPSIRGGKRPVIAWSGRCEWDSTIAAHRIIEAARAAAAVRPRIPDRDTVQAHDGIEAPEDADHAPLFRIDAISDALSMRPATPMSPGIASPEVPLAAHLDGLTSSAVQCPFAPSIQYAVDAAGRWHLLAREGADSVEALMIASAWTATHAALLNLAAASIPGAVRAAQLPASPTMHLFAAQATDVRRLLDLGVRVHLLTPALPQRIPGWLCADLN